MALPLVYLASPRGCLASWFANVAPFGARAQSSQLPRSCNRAVQAIRANFICARWMRSWRPPADATQAGCGSGSIPRSTCRGAFPRARARRAAPMATIRPQQGRTGAGRRTGARGAVVSDLTLVAPEVRMPMLPGGTWPCRRRGTPMRRSRCTPGFGIKPTGSARGSHGQRAFPSTLCKWQSITRGPTT
jgi:hypothetical protein